MSIPRDVSGKDLCKALKIFGYQITRQKGSHIRLSTSTPDQHHITIPDHQTLKIGTLNAIIDSVATHVGISKDELIHKLFSK